MIISRKIIMTGGMTGAVLGFVSIILTIRSILPTIYDTVMAALYNVSGRVLFVDLGDILRAGVCWRHGVNVYQPSSCLHGGIFNYSPLLLYVARLPINVGDQQFGGVVMAVVFIASLSLLPTARNWHELFFRCGAGISTTVWYAIEQGNFDILLFAGVMLAVWFVKKSRQISSVGYLLIGFGAAAKFYPAILFALGFRERLAKLMILAAVGSLVTVVVLVFYGADILHAVSMIPKSQPFRATFGASDLSSGLALLHILPWRSAPHIIRPYYPAASLALDYHDQNILTALLSLGAVIGAWQITKKKSAALLIISSDRQIFLIAGALVVVFCFFAAQNVDYRGIYLLMLVPGLWELAYPWTAKGEKTPRALIIVILVLLWEAAIRAMVVKWLIPVSAGVEAAVMMMVWLARELLWWWLIVQLMALIMAFIQNEVLRLSRELHHL